MTKVYDLPKGRRIIAGLDENGIIKVTVQALDSLIGELNYYADKVCDIEQIRAEISALPVWKFSQKEVLQIIDKYRGDK